MTSTASAAGSNFGNAVRPVNGAIPVSVGGSSDEAYRVGGSLRRHLGLWGEPLEETKEQIDRVWGEAEKAGRIDRPRIWVTFPSDHRRDRRPGLEEGARGARIAPSATPQTATRSRGRRREPQNLGSQRLLDIAARGEVQDRALWYPTVTATGARGASTALVGSPDTIAESIVDYVEIGADLISIRGYDNLNDAIDYGRYVLPLVHEKLAARNLMAAV
ncbi:LLM class flavin-dependent oxidoreductase [Aeromicrobium sp. UC242_57]|uniref:LLM class flavin-dependent oxidoreductase n=1 Tax=Aeromicrobium sp. UC242_57 TaxID=3374624 RepID=UPI0037BB3464